MLCVICCSLFVELHSLAYQDTNVRSYTRFVMELWGGGGGEGHKFFEFTTGSEAGHSPEVTLALVQMDAWNGYSEF